MAFQTEYEFTLPKGYVDSQGNLHKNGIMRLATAADEILPMKDPRVQSNPSYLSIILLARVVTKLGDLRMVDTHVIENLFSSDFSFLQNFYREINENGSTKIKTLCPECKKEIEVDMNQVGEF